MHSDILNYTKLAFNGLKMIQNDTVYLSANQTGVDRALINVEYLGSLFFIIRPICINCISIRKCCNIV